MTSNNFQRYIAWKGGQVRRAVHHHVSRMLSCRTAKLGLHLFGCSNCPTVKVVPHSCKSVFCSSCGKVRTDQWCDELLSDLLEVPYRHLVFTLPWELRLVIQDNRRVLLNVLFRAAANAKLKGWHSFLMLLFYRHRILYSYNRDYLKVYTLDLDKTHMLTISLVSQKGGDGGIFCCPMP